MDLRKMFFGVGLLSVLCVDVRATNLEEEECKRATPSTSVSSIASVFYDELSTEAKYNANLKYFKQDRATSLPRMEVLAREENYEEAQLYLAECYRSGVFGKPDIEKAIELNGLALEKNRSFLGAFFLGCIYWSDGYYEKSREYCAIAKAIASEKSLNSTKVDLLLKQIELDETS